MIKRKMIKCECNGMEVLCEKCGGAGEYPEGRLNLITRIILKLAVILLIIAITAVITWRVTILTLQIEVHANSVYVTSFGQTDIYDLVIK